MNAKGKGLRKNNRPKVRESFPPPGIEWGDEKRRRRWMMYFVSEPAQVRAPDGRSLGELLLATGAAAENFGRLAPCFQGWQAQALHRMARESRAQLACLGGIYALVTGEPPRQAVPVPDTGTPAVRLKKAYARAMHLLTACQTHSAGPEYGPVFQRLAARQQDHCRKILEIIGSL